MSLHIPLQWSNTPFQPNPWCQPWKHGSLPKGFLLSAGLWMMWQFQRFLPALKIHLPCFRCYPRNRSLLKPQLPLLYLVQWFLCPLLHPYLLLTLRKPVWIQLNLLLRLSLWFLPLLPLSHPCQRLPLLFPAPLLPWVLPLSPAPGFLCLPLPLELLSLPSAPALHLRSHYLQLPAHNDA